MPKNPTIPMNPSMEPSGHPESINSGRV